MTDATHPTGLVVLGDGVIALHGDDAIASSRSFRRIHVGDGAVAAVTYARQGLDAILVTRVGDDPFTDELLSTWDSEGLHLDFARQVSGRNGLVLLPFDGQDSVSFRAASVIAGVDPSDLTHFPWELADSIYTTGRMQVLGESARATLLRAFSDAKKRGVKTVFNPMFSPGLWGAHEGRLAVNAFEDMLPLTDTLILRAPLGTGHLLFQATAMEAAQVALKKGPSSVVIQDATRGFVAATGDECVAIDAPRADLHPCMEAVFDGALIAALARGETLADAVRLAAGVASETAKRPIGIEHIPHATPLNSP